MNHVIERLLPLRGFRGGEYVPMWADSPYRLFSLSRKYLIAEAPGKFPRIKNITDDWPGAYLIRHSVVLNDFIYAKCVSENGEVVIRYNRHNLKLPGTVMAFHGQSIGKEAYGAELMTCDGTYFYFTHKAGHTRNDCVISKYEISDTGFTYLNDITCGDESNIFNHIVALSNGSIYSFHWNGIIRKFNTNGERVLMCKPFPNAPAISQLLVIGDGVYVNSGQYFQLINLE